MAEEAQELIREAQGLIKDDQNPKEEIKEETSATATTGRAAAEARGKATEYVVLRGESKDGPFNVAGIFTAQGQINAKKAAAGEDAAKNDDPESHFYVAVPASSFKPQKPIIQITFATESETESEDDD